MSSHHVVKAKQEPALLILSLNGFDLEYLGQLLEWSPTILVSADVYEEVESLGIKIDVVLGLIEAAQSDAIQIDVLGDYLSAGVSYLTQEGYPAMNIISESHLSLESSSYDAINIVWFCGTTKIYRVKSGFKVWKAAEVQFSLPKGIETSNLTASSEGLFVVETDGFVTFNSASDTFFIKEYL